MVLTCRCTDLESLLGLGVHRYQNEEQTGQAIAAAGLKREELWVTTKFSGRLG
jgi:hypothetical protein